MKYYLAGPWFSIEQEKNYREAVQILQKTWLKPEDELFIPADHHIDNEWSLSNLEWGKKVFELDLKALDEADEVIALDYGYVGDTGTAWEIGYAYAKKKPIYIVTCKKDTIYSLMCINSASNVYSLHDLNKSFISFIKSSIEVK